MHLANSTAIAAFVPGCSLATAHSIAPSLQHFRRDSDKEYAALSTWQKVFMFSSLVSLETPDSIVLEIQGSLKLFAQTTLLTQPAVCAKTWAIPASRLWRRLPQQPSPALAAKVSNYISAIELLRS